MRVPEGGEHPVLHVINESEGVAVSISSSSSAGSADEQWVRSTRRCSCLSRLTPCACAAAPGRRAAVHRHRRQLLRLLLHAHRSSQRGCPRADCRAR